MPDIHFSQLVTDVDGRRKFKNFHNLLFKNTNVSSAWVSWWFDHVAPKTRVYVALDTNKFGTEEIIGMWCVEPKRLHTLVDEINVGRCFSVGIHPDYRRQNLFVRLSEFAINEEKKLAQCAYILGFPQAGRPVVEAHLKSGWEFVQEITINGFDPQSRQLWDSRCDTPLQHCSRELSRAADLYLDGSVSFVDSYDFAVKRWTMNPDNDYRILGYRDAYVVTKTYRDVCHVLEVKGASDESVRYLLDTVNTLAYRHRCSEVTIWNAYNEHHYDVIRAAGFVDSAKNASSVQLLAVKITATEPLVVPVVHFQMGNEEMY